MTESPIVRSSAPGLVAQVLDVQVLIWLDHRLLLAITLSGCNLGGHEAIEITFTSCLLPARCGSSSPPLLHGALILVLHPEALFLQVLGRISMYWLAEHVVEIRRCFGVYVFQLLPAVS